MLQLKIGKLAQKTGISIDTIRYYERRGILPAPQRLASGYRIYSDAAVSRITMAKSLQALGFSLDEIVQNLADLDVGALDCESGEQRMQVVLQRVDHKINELMAVKSNIENLLAECRVGNCQFCEPKEALDEHVITD